MAEQPKDLVQLSADEPKAGEFEIKCLGCGSLNTEVYSRIEGSESMGFDSECEIHCKNCGAVKVVSQY